MKKIRSLDYYQKSILIIMAAMSLIFAFIYYITVSKIGYEYNDTILVPAIENGNTVYSGEIYGEQTRFTIYTDNSMILQYGDKTYGPYIIKEDSSAIPEKEDLADMMTGIEIYNGEMLLFRGGVLEVTDDYWLYNQDGTLDNFGITYVTEDGFERDENGNVIDRIEPSAYTIYTLLNNPELTHKGEAIAWFGAFFICILNALSILFADELFKFNLSFQIRNVDNVEPSDWEIVGRYIGWTVMTVMALVLFVMGLK